MGFALLARLSGTVVASGAVMGSFVGTVDNGSTPATFVGTVSQGLVAAYNATCIRTGYRVVLDGVEIPDRALVDVDLMLWPRARGEAPVVVNQHRDTLVFASTLDAGVVAAAVLPLTSMTTLELWRYGVHLDDQAQAAQQVQIRFWKKALYPLSCLVMVALALPFAYLHARAGGVSLKVFGGIMLGIGFVLLNNLAGHIGMLRDWTPWIVASVPSLLFLLMSLAAFGWLVRYR